MMPWRNANDLKKKMNEQLSEKTIFWLKLAGFFCLGGLFLVFLTEKINLTTADLGRHLANGELFWQGENRGAFLKTNFYSYTNSDFSFINHHWASGVLFFLIWKIFGFGGVHLFFLLLAFSAFGIFFYLAQKKGGYFWTFIFSLLLIPLLAQRQEVRPEIFGCLFGGIFFLLLWGSGRKIFSSNWLWLLPFFQLLWINLHISFFLGILILGIFLFQSGLDGFRGKDFFLFKKISGIFLACLASLFLNPNGFRGVIYPLQIFNNFGYALAENKSIRFLENFGMKNPNFFLLKIVLLLLFGSFIWIVWKKRKSFSWADFFLATVFSVMALSALRNMSLFAFFAWPILAANFRKIFLQKINLDPAVFSAGLLSWVVLIFLVYNPLAKGNWGLGLVEKNNASAEFFLGQNIQGPIFNNYDIGGYLIFHLKNKEKVFVDNRPEAYPAEFFQQTYIPMQEDQKVWQEMATRHGFNSVFFYRHDLTPWGQKFLVSLVDDPSWAPVFVDDYAIIFLKRNEKNQKVIDEFQLPREMFKVK